MGFYDGGERPAPRCKSPVIKCFARLVAARCGMDGVSVGRWNRRVVGMCLYSGGPALHFFALAASHRRPRDGARLQQCVTQAPSHLVGRLLLVLRHRLAKCPLGQLPWWWWFCVLSCVCVCVCTANLSKYRLCKPPVQLSVNGTEGEIPLKAAKLVSLNEV